MEIMLIVGVYAALAVQAWRNHLLMKQIEKPMQLPTILVEPGHVDYDAIARALEASWPTVNVTNEIEACNCKLDIDYVKLGNLLLTLKSAPTATAQPFPQIGEPIQPVVQPHNVTEVEVNGQQIPVKNFPAK